MMQTSLRRAMIAQKQIVGGQMRYFGAAPEPVVGKASGRMTGNPSHYNKRFESSTSLDNNYVDFQAYIRGASGFEPK